MKTIQEVQKEIFDEINEPRNQIYLRVQKKDLERESYLSQIRKRCKNEGLDEEDTEDIVFLVDKSLWGFGVIDDLIMDPDISDIRLMDENHVRIKKEGKRYPTSVKFNSKQEYEKYIDFITSRNNTNMSVVNAAQVFTDKDSCPTDILRFSLVSDLVNTGERPTLLIRKIPKQKRSIAVLEEKGLFTPEQYEYIKNRWQEGHGLLICGPNGSGKTTLANQVLEETPHEKSAVVIQESEELFCSSHPEMVFRKVIPQKNGSTVSYSIKDLARLALMESFDIIIVGEIKGDEAAELSYATYTGSQTMTTVHSNSAKEGYEKLIDYALDAQPNRTREHFAKQFKSLDTVVYVSDFKCKEIYELGNYDKLTQEYTFKEIRFGKEDVVDVADTSVLSGVSTESNASDKKAEQFVTEQQPVKSFDEKNVEQQPIRKADVSDERNGSANSYKKQNQNSSQNERQNGNQNRHENNNNRRNDRNDRYQKQNRNQQKHNHNYQNHNNDQRNNENQCDQKQGFVKREVPVVNKSAEPVVKPFREERRDVEIDTSTRHYFNAPKNGVPNNGKVIQIEPDEPKREEAPVYDDGMDIIKQIAQFNRNADARNGSLNTDEEDDNY